MYIFCTFLLFSLLFATAETQTDWAGGPGVQGPVTDWQDSFYIANNMDWDTTPGQIKLKLDKTENPITSPYEPFSAISCDVDLDGDQDVLCCAHSGEISWAENANGVGTEWIKHTFAVIMNPETIVSADFDNNGYKDIAVSSVNSNQVLLMLCSEEGWINATSISNSFFASEIIATDVDRDGLIDIVGSSSFSNSVSWLKNNGTGTEWTKIYIDTAFDGVDACDAGDFNGDGYPDIAASSNYNNTIIAYLSSDPFGYSWEKYVLEVAYSDPVSIAVADFNNDGNEDFAVASSSDSGSLCWYDFIDTQSSWITHEMTGAVGENIHDIHAQDIDGDGYPDLLIASSDENRITMCKNREYLGENWRIFPVSGYFGGAVGVSTGDMDGDNAPDVLGCSSAENQISWWRVSGFSTPGTVTSSILDVQPYNPDYTTWNYIHWSSTVPYQSGIRIRLKTSFTSENMGPWSEWLTSPGDLGSVVAEGGQFLQYQAELHTANSHITPSLKDVTILVNSPGSVDDEYSSLIDGRRVWFTSGNPVSGSFSVGYRIETTGPVSIAVYDVTGRSVAVINEGSMAAGEYTGMVTGLPAGSYAVVMECAEGTAALRIVVVR